MIYGRFSAKATAKDLTKHMSPRKPKLCMRKNGESRHESLWGLEPNRYPVFDAADLVLTYEFKATRIGAQPCMLLVLLSDACACWSSLVHADRSGNFAIHKVIIKGSWEAILPCYGQIEF